MHVPDGFLSSPTCAVTGAVAVAGVALAHRASRRELGDDGVPMAALVTSFVFAAQMVNVPIAAGISGHVMGGALAAVLVGPATATLCLSAVLLVQAVVFADGGITALGTNVVLMALVGVWVGWAVHRAVLRFARSDAAVAIGAGLGALASVVASAVTFTGLYAAGGHVDVPLDDLAASMIRWHSLIGVGEGIVTAVVVALVLATRRDAALPGRPVAREAAAR